MCTTPTCPLHTTLCRPCIPCTDIPALAQISLPDTCSLLCANACNQVVGPLVLSCLIGICMSHASYLLREAVSATLFTVVGIVCKVRRAVVEWFRV